MLHKFEMPLEPEPQLNRVRLVYVPFGRLASILYQHLVAGSADAGERRMTCAVEGGLPEGSTVVGSPVIDPARGAFVFTFYHPSFGPVEEGRVIPEHSPIALQSRMFSPAAACSTAFELGDFVEHRRRFDLGRMKVVGLDSRPPHLVWCRSERWDDREPAEPCRPEHLMKVSG